VNKDLKALIKRLERNGYRVVPAGKHLKVKNADGGTVFTLPSTPSGQLWRVRLETSLRRKGLIE
jgi:predicted RNA binding protein YcfA (HicA-like mRNA interferase family)